jgi:hypothetical protein
MPPALVEIRPPSLVLGASPDGSVWLSFPRAGAGAVGREWHRRPPESDSAARVGLDGVIHERLTIPKLTGFVDLGETLVGVGGEAGEASLVRTRGAEGREGFDLRTAVELRAEGALRALVGGDRAVVVGASPDGACVAWNLATGARLGSWPVRPSEQLFWAFDADRVYSSSATTQAWAPSGEPIWARPIRTRPSAGIAAFAGDVWLVEPTGKGHDLVCLAGDTGEIVRRARIPAVHALVASGAGLFIGHELGVSLVRARAGRPSTLLKARVDALMTDGRGWAALSRESQQLFVAASAGAKAATLALAGHAMGELDLAFVTSGHAVLRPLAETEDERTTALLRDERRPRAGRVLCWVPLLAPRGARALQLARFVVELDRGEPSARRSGERHLGQAEKLAALSLSEADRRLMAALGRHGILPKSWHPRLESVLLRSETRRVGSLLAQVFSDAPEKGQRLGFFSGVRLRQRGQRALVQDLERLLRDEPVGVKEVLLAPEETSLLVASGRTHDRVALGASDDPLDVASALNRALESAGASRRLLVLESEPGERAFLLWEPERATTLRRGGIKGVGKPA